MGDEANPQRIPREFRLQHDFSFQGTRASGWQRKGASHRCLTAELISAGLNWKISMFLECHSKEWWVMSPAWPSLAPTDSGKQQRRCNVCWCLGTMDHRHVQVGDNAIDLPVVTQNSYIKLDMISRLHVATNVYPYICLPEAECGVKRGGFGCTACESLELAWCCW